MTESKKMAAEYYNSGGKIHSLESIRLKELTEQADKQLRILEICLWITVGLFVTILIGLPIAVFFI